MKLLVVSGAFIFELEKKKTLKNHFLIQAHGKKEIHCFSENSFVLANLILSAITLNKGTYNSLH